MSRLLGQRLAHLLRLRADLPDVVTGGLELLGDVADLLRHVLHVELAHRAWKRDAEDTRLTHALHRGTARETDGRAAGNRAERRPAHRAGAVPRLRGRGLDRLNGPVLALSPALRATGPALRAVGTALAARAGGGGGARLGFRAAAARARAGRLALRLRRGRSRPGVLSLAGGHPCLLLRGTRGLLPGRTSA